MAHPPGIVKTKLGWRAFKRVNGKLYSKRFPPDTPIETMKLWRKGKEVAIKTGERIAAIDAAKEPAFEDDAERYLDSVRSMPSFSDRALHMREWAAHFQGRPRNSITAIEIKTRLEGLIADGYAPMSVNNRRVALQSFYVALNGKGGVNPARDVPNYGVDLGAPRGKSFGLVYRILACMGESKTRARLRVMLWTGLPHRQLTQLRPEHVDLKHARVWITPRRKGKNARQVRAGRWMPLLPGAVAALREFHTLDCYCAEGKRFSNSSIHSAFARALAKLNAHRAKLGLPAVTMRPYDLRHSFGTMLAERVKDDRAIQELMLHSDIRMTRRYTEAATSQRVASALASIAQAKS
jgi:integrase